MKKTQKQKTKKEVQRIKEEALWTAKPARRRLIFRWVEAAVFTAPFFVLWTALMKGITVGLILATIGFFCLFFGIAIWLSLLLQKKTQYVITTKNIYVRSGIVSTLTSKLPVSEIVFFRKVLTLADFFLKNTTGTIKVFVITNEKMGRKKLKIDPICSMFGIKQLEKPIEILRKLNVKEIKSNNEIQAKKYELQIEGLEERIARKKQKKQSKNKNAA